MIYTRKRDLLAAVLAGALCLTSAYAQKAPDGAPPTPGFNTYLPQDILTPDTVYDHLADSTSRAAAQQFIPADHAPRGR